MGTSAALELSRRGAAVVLVERGELAVGASGRNHGLLLRPLEPELIPMAESSRASYTNVAAEAPLPVHIDADRIGFLIVPVEPGETDAAAAEARAAIECGLEVERVEGPALGGLEPELAADLEMGWLLHDGYRLDPSALTVAHALLATGLGADIRLHLTVRALDLRGERVRGVVTDQGLITAGTVVLAAGPWCPPLLARAGIRLPLSGARGWLVHLAPSRPVVRHLVARAGWHLLPVPEPLAPTRVADLARDFPAPVVGALIHANPDGTMLVGASRQPALTIEPEDPTVPLQIVRTALRMFPALRDAGVLSSWWGIRPMSADGRPAIGFVREGLLLATGHGSQGVILAGGTAKLVASLVAAEDPPFDPTPFRPDRFGPGGKAAEASGRAPASPTIGA